MDGSVQYYAVQPATQTGPQALVLSVHGANVEAWNQASSYSPKSWAHIVAPTNRRAYGYNREDWGRVYPMDVLDRAERELEVDRERIYLTGHSMEGHLSNHMARNRSVMAGSLRSRETRSRSMRLCKARWTLEADPM